VGVNGLIQTKPIHRHRLRRCCGFHCRGLLQCSNPCFLWSPTAVPAPRAFVSKFCLLGVSVCVCVFGYWPKPCAGNIMIAINSICYLVSTTKCWPIYLATYVLLLLFIHFFELLPKYAPKLFLTTHPTTTSIL
jgi:hypothetical protein